MNIFWSFLSTFLKVGFRVSRHLFQRSIVFLVKKSYSKIWFPKSSKNFLGFWELTFRQSCQNENLSVQRKLCCKMYLFLRIYLDLSIVLKVDQKLFDFRLKNSARVVKLSFNEYWRRSGNFFGKFSRRTSWTLSKLAWNFWLRAFSMFVKFAFHESRRSFGDVYR